MDFNNYISTHSNKEINVTNVTKKSNEQNFFA